MFIHGLYDFLQFLLAEGYLAIIGFVLGVLIVLLSYIYIRKRACFWAALPMPTRMHPFLGQQDPPCLAHATATQTLNDTHTCATTLEHRTTTGVLFLLKSFPEELDVHQMLLRGDIEAPGVLCCTPTVCE